MSMEKGIPCNWEKPLIVRGDHFFYNRFPLCRVKDFPVFPLYPLLPCKYAVLVKKVPKGIAKSFWTHDYIKQMHKKYNKQYLQEEGFSPVWIFFTWSFSFEFWWRHFSQYPPPPLASPSVTILWTPPPLSISDVICVWSLSEKKNISYLHLVSFQHCFSKNKTVWPLSGFNSNKQS
jgi:hypothetical protein